MVNRKWNVAWCSYLQFVHIERSRKSAGGTYASYYLSNRVLSFFVLENTYCSRNLLSENTYGRFLRLIYHCIRLRACWRLYDFFIYFFKNLCVFFGSILEIQWYYSVKYWIIHVINGLGRYISSGMYWRIAYWSQRDKWDLKLLNCH